ncbi:hypothetical protein J437_LFUL000942 [Ladona fulva]|uniref:DDE-1 domain-containing protein n=1 Tax=Ladona fulva TaxID=123851 RepID=A0A8K0K844_LADFU|nr:hypothetical protein J437_LFUL000942 [Ladona fulva]
MLTVNPTNLTYKSLNVDKVFESCITTVTIIAQTFIVVTVYRSPSGDFDLFLSKLNSILELMHKSIICPNIIITGNLHAKWENWMMAGIHEYNKTGQMKRPSYKDIVTWIAESWAAVSESCVRNGFLGARGDETYNENENVDDVTLSEINSEEVPKEILNVFSIECITSSATGTLSNNFPPTTNSLFLKPCTDTELAAIISKLSSRQEAGPDEIPGKILFSSYNMIKFPLLFLINESLKQVLAMASLSEVAIAKEVNRDDFSIVSDSSSDSEEDLISIPSSDSECEEEEISMSDLASESGLQATWRPTLHYEDPRDFAGERGSKQDLDVGSNEFSFLRYMLGETNSPSFSRHGPTQKDFRLALYKQMIGNFTSRKISGCKRT